MTQSRRSSRAEAKRREEAWLADYWRREEQLQALGDSDLDTLVAATVFGNPALADTPFSSRWDGLGLIVERMRQLGYTMLLNSYEQSHLDWLNTLADSVKQADRMKIEDVYRAAEVTVVDFRGCSALRLKGRADTLPRAVATAAVLALQMQQQTVTSPAPLSAAGSPGSGWTEERRQRHSEQMKAYWQRKNTAGLVSKEGV